MTKVKSALSRTNAFVAAMALAFASIVVAVPMQSASAANALLNRSMMVTSTVPSDDLTAPDGSTYSGLAAGDPRNGAQVGHTYEFTVGTTGNINGMTIEYCTTAFGFIGTGACTGPTGFSASPWSGASVTVTNITQSSNQSFSITANASNYLTLTSGANLSATTGDVIRIVFTPVTGQDYFVNPNTAYITNNDANGDSVTGDRTFGTYFAHFNTFAQASHATSAFATTDGDNSSVNTNIVDEGTVTNSVTEAISIYTRVQETLNFSVEGEGGTGDASPGGPTPVVTPGCTPLTETGSIVMGDSNFALSTTQKYNATSYFRLATNASNGTSVFYSGDTLKSGTRDIDPMDDTAAELQVPGTEQFGLGINTGAGTVFNNLSAIAPYASASLDQYAFNVNSVTTPVVIAQAVGNIVDCETGRVDYVANIADTTPAGIYTTKLNYIASPIY